MSRKNNLKRRRVHHAAMLADERAREAVMKKNRERRQASKGKSEADAELSVAMVRSFVPIDKIVVYVNIMD